MTYDEIRNFRTDIETPRGMSHESVMRAYHIVEKVKWLCGQGVSTQVLLELIALMESEPQPKEKR